MDKKELNFKKLLRFRKALLVLNPRPEKMLAPLSAPTRCLRQTIAEFRYTRFLAL
jgi:hypothetical protein